MLTGDVPKKPEKKKIEKPDIEEKNETEEKKRGPGRPPKKEQ